MLAVITGATSGIGLEFARRLADRGCDLIVVGRRAEVLKTEAERIEAHGVSVTIVTGDLARTETWDALIRAVGSSPLEYLVNNAGSGFHSDLVDASIDRIRDLNRLLATLPIETIRALMPNLIMADHAVVINVGSLAGRVAVPGSSIYSAAKIYLERASESIALELAPRGICVQVLTPGYVRTDFHRDVPDYKSKQRGHGLIRWLDPDRVVSLSLRRADHARSRIAQGRRQPARDIVVTPGLANRTLAMMARITPRALHYFAALNRRRLE